MVDIGRCRSIWGKHLPFSAKTAPCFLLCWTSCRTLFGHCPEGAEGVVRVNIIINRHRRKRPISGPAGYRDNEPLILKIHKELAAFAQGGILKMRWNAIMKNIKNGCLRLRRAMDNLFDDHGDVAINIFQTTLGPLSLLLFLCYSTG